MLTIPVSYRRILRAYLRPLVVTALDPGSPEALVLDPELLWAARLDELEQVELWTPKGDRMVTSVGLGIAGEVQVHGRLTQKFHAGDVLTVAAYAFVPPDTLEAHLAHFVEIGNGNRAIEIKCRTIRAQKIHPSYVSAESEGEAWAVPAMSEAQAALGAEAR